MVEELRIYTKKLSKNGYEEAARKIMDLAESLNREGMLPDKLEIQAEVLNRQLAQRVREVVGPLDDNFSLAILLNPQSEMLGRSARAIIPPQGWRELLQNLDGTERVVLGKAITALWKTGLRDIGSIRKTTVNDLASRRRIGMTTAQFMKAAFESQPLPLFDRSNLL